MTDETVDRDVVEFVRLGLKVSHHFLARMRNRATFEAVLAAVDAANEFDPMEVLRTFGPLFDDVSAIDVGAEGTVVLYVNIPHYPSQCNGAKDNPNERYTDEQRQELTQRVIAWANKVRADEVATEQSMSMERVWNAPGDNPGRVRIWWD